MESDWKLLKSVKYLQTISTTIGLTVPNLYFYNGLTIGYILYWSILFLSIMSISIYLVAIEITQFLKIHVDMQTLLELLSVSFIFMSIAFSMISFIILKRRKVVKLCHFLGSLEICLKNKFRCDIYYNEVSVTLKIFIWMFCNMFTIICDFLFSFNYNNQSEYFMMLWFYFNYYHFVTSIVVLQIHLFSHQIKCLFVFLNVQFLEMSSITSVEGSDSFRHFIYTETIFFIRRYNDLHKTMNVVNQVYCTYLILTVICIMSLSGLSGLSIILKTYNPDVRNVTCNLSAELLSWFINIIKNLVSKTIIIIKIFIL